MSEVHGGLHPHMLFMVHPEYRRKRPANQFIPRLYGFKIHHLAYQIQQQAVANFKAPMRTMSYNSRKRFKKFQRTLHRTIIG